MKYGVSLLVTLFAIIMASMTIMGAEQDGSEFVLDEVEGEIVKNKNDEQTNMYLNSANIKQENGLVKGTGSLIVNGYETSISLNGNMYPITGDSPYAGQVVLGDMESDSDYNILQFRIENTDEKAMLSIVLEDKESGEWIQFKKDVKQEVFKTFFEGSNKLVVNNDMEESDIIEKTTRLLNIHNKAEHGEEIPNSIEVEQRGTEDTEGEFTIDEPISTQNFTTVPVDMNELYRMLDDLNDPFTDSVNLGDYNLPEDLFRGSDWKKDINLDESPRANYYALSMEQIDFTITQLATFMHESGYTDWNNDGDQIDYDIGITYTGGILLVYDHFTNEINVLQYGLGLSLQNMHIAQGPLQDRNVYYAQTLSEVNLTEDGDDLIGYLVGLVPYGSQITDIWGVLSTSSNSTLGNRERFIGSTYEEQIDLHRGDVYRVSSGILSNWNLEQEEANTNLYSEIHSGDGYVSLGWGLRTTVSSNL